MYIYVEASAEWWPLCSYFIDIMYMTTVAYENQSVNGCKTAYLIFSFNASLLLL